MNTAIKTTIIRVINDVGLHVSNEGISQIAQGIVDELDAKSLGYVIGRAAETSKSPTGYYPFCYWRVAERIYRLLESKS